MEIRYAVIDLHRGVLSHIEINEKTEDGWHLAIHLRWKPWHCGYLTAVLYNPIEQCVCTMLVDEHSRRPTSSKRAR